jgi:hypothetical protein
MGRLTQAASVLSLPPTLAHEATHYLAARAAGTDDAQIAVEVLGGRAVTAWEPIEHPLARAFAMLAPTVFGVILASIWVISGAELSGWRYLAALGLLIYSMPSETDIRGALGRQAVQENT